MRPFLFFLMLLGISTPLLLRGESAPLSKGPGFPSGFFVPVPGSGGEGRDAVPGEL
ncbi:hypothetical protein HMPREF1986_02387 [Oribacterium sp. oral taxon 078 str. F0263]|nr:hypothetical protein HMPREF1986_02387 [Oribacterium sp. oral taxon 078 str. F0263]